MNLKQLIIALKSRFSKSDIARRMASGAFWSFSGTAIAKFIVLVSGILCAHILTKDEYGQFGLVRSTITMFAVFGSGCLGRVASKHIAQYRDVSQERIPSVYLLTNGMALGLGVLFTTILFAIAPFIAVNMLHAPELLNAVRIGCVLMFFTILNDAQTGTLSGFENFKAIAINTLAGSIAESAFMLLGARFFGVVGAVLGFGTGYFVIYISNFISIKRVFKQSGIFISKDDFKHMPWPLLYQFGLPSMFSAAIVPFAYWVLRTNMVRNFGFGELAAYEAADQWRMIIVFIPTAVSQIVLPILSSTLEKGKTSFWHLARINLLFNGGIAFAFALVVSCFSHIILGFYGDSYISGTSALILLAFSTVFSSLANVAGIMMYCHSKTWHNLAFNALWACMVIGLNQLFIGKGLGATGAALAILLSYVLHTTFQLSFLHIALRKQKQKI